MATTTLKYFAYEHLPVHLQAVSKPIGQLAEKIESVLPDGPEKSAGMRKLLEAKDCFVRAALDAPKTGPMASTLQPHQQRVVDEKTELDDRLQKLDAFIKGNPVFTSLAPEEQLRMVRQANAMSAYSEVLGERIAAFN